MPDSTDSPLRKLGKNYSLNKYNAYNRNMGKKIVAGYIIFCIIFFIVLLVFATLRIQTTWNASLSMVKKKFEVFENVVSSLFLSLEPEAMRSQIRDIVKEEDRLLLTAIYSTNQGLLYLSAVNRFYVKPPEENSRGESRPKYTGLPIGSHTLTLPFPGEENETFFIDGIYTVMGKADIFPITREIFMILFVFFITTCIILLLLPTIQKEERPAEKSTGVTTEGESEEVTETPRNLFSPRTGLGWSEHLHQRLKLELDRAATFDQDLVLALLSIDGFSTLVDSEKVYERIAKFLLNEFTFQDCAFEYNPGSYAVIIPDFDLDQGIQSLDTFKKKISSVKIEDSSQTLSVGLSSRNGRLVNGATLLAETSKALAKAEQEGKNRLIAFRASPEKYRNMISQKN